MSRRDRGVPGRIPSPLLLLSCLFLTALSAFFFARSLMTPDTGLIRYDPEVVWTDKGVLFSPSSPFSAPLAAGAAADSDLILSLNGLPTTGTRDVVRAALGLRGFASYALNVKGPGEAPRILHVQPFFRPARMDWVFEFVFCVALGAAAFTLWRKVPNAASTIPLALSILLSMLFTCIMPFSFESLPENALANAGNVASWLLVIFAMYFPSPRGSRPVRVLVVGSVAALYAAFCTMRALLFFQWMSGGTESALTAYRALGRLVIVSDGAAYAALAALLASAYARSRLPRDRRMLQWMLAGVLIAFPPYFFLDQLPLLIGGPLHHVGLGSLAQLFLSVLPLCLLLALTRSSAMNFRSFLARYGIHAILLVLAVVGFGTLYLPLSELLASAYHAASPAPQVLSAVVLVAALTVLRVPLERLFSPRWKSPVEGLHGFVGLAEASSVSSRRLEETRAVFSGIARTLRRPLSALVEAAAARGTMEQKEAGAEAAFFLSTLESLAGSPSSPAGLLSGPAAAHSAVEAVRSRYPCTCFRLFGEANGEASAEATSGEANRKFHCRVEEVVRALVLLLENAAEAEPRAGATVEVRFSTDFGRAVIEVVDEGPGMGTLARRRMFRPFWTTKPGHRGLGLYVARLLIERNEGGVTVTTVSTASAGAGGGVIARVAFPLATEDL